MKYRNLFKPKWLDSFIRKYFKRFYMKRYLKIYPGAIYQAETYDGSISVAIDLNMMFDFGDAKESEFIKMVDPFSEELDELVEVYRKMIKIINKKRGL